jgi:hypothetical protein
MEFSGERGKSSPGYILGVRPYCRCCAGGHYRKGRTLSRAKSNFQTRKANRTSHKINERLRYEGRPEKYND